jgi:multimeric flavodoxin WrbA
MHIRLKYIEMPIFTQKIPTNMKVLLINGSPRREGNTHVALSEAASALESCGVQTEMVSIGTKPVQGCTACNKCYELGRCAFRDELYETVREKIMEADGLIIGTPVYYAGPNGSLCALLDRLFYSCGDHLAYKPGAAVAVCRRGGASTAFDRLNKYFSINNMPQVPSQYWNIVYGRKPGESAQDAEGLQTMRTLGRNMAWMLNNIESGGQTPPEPEEWLMTNFIK